MVSIWKNVWKEVINKVGNFNPPCQWARGIIMDHLPAVAICKCLKWLEFLLPWFVARGYFCIECNSMKIAAPSALQIVHLVYDCSALFLCIWCENNPVSTLFETGLHLALDESLHVSVKSWIIYPKDRSVTGLNKMYIRCPVRLSDGAAMIGQPKDSE